METPPSRLRFLPDDCLWFSYMLRIDPPVANSVSDDSPNDTDHGVISDIFLGGKSENIIGLGGIGPIKGTIRFDDRKILKYSIRYCDQIIQAWWMKGSQLPTRTLRFASGEGKRSVDTSNIRYTNSKEQSSRESPIILSTDRRFLCTIDYLDHVMHSWRCEICG